MQRAACALKYVVEEQRSLGPCDSTDLAVEGVLVCDVHLNVLGPDDIEGAIIEGHLQCASLSERDFFAQPHHPCEGVGGIHIFPGEVDSRDLALVLRGQVACRAPKATSHVQDVRAWLKRDAACEFDRGLAPADVKLIDRCEVLGSQPSEILSCLPQRD